ncbi:glycosyltransferase family 1 protein [Tumidithrix elongata RA019]|uniref:Glycosyltransferase family 1 protein n=1 Tax=Tumidithrix elongata BACA0141 TaxID=2716417 RepID=A0AAW9PZ96_9CYAN|nr:glycosyltransferase family 1 protein [Tumidithrix elongata RA019]
MKLGISGLFLKPSQVGGAEFMLRGLLFGLAQIPNLQLYVFIDRKLTDWLRELNLGEAHAVIPITMVGNRVVSEITQIPWQANRLGLDGIIYPNYLTPWRSLLKMPSATVIHDLNYLHFPDLFSWRKKVWLRTAHQNTLANSDITVAISEFVRNDIVKNYPLKSQHSLTVIPNPILWERFSHSMPPVMEVKQPFILTVANHYQHKNLATLIKAFQQLPSACDQVNLVLVGQLPESLVGMRRDRCDDLSSLVKALNLQDRVKVTGYISDAELAWYYNFAEMFAYPSLFEGFGMPPVEAMGMGLPTLTTRCTAIPEATLGLAQYINDPLDVDEWRDRMAQILQFRSDFLPLQSTVDLIRSTYDPVAIAQKYVDLFKCL